MKVKNIFKTFVVLITGLFCSCSIGLGEAVDLIAPTVEISSPESFASISQTFELKGSATDNYAITNVIIEVAKNNKVVHLFKLEDSKWYSESNGNWKEYSNGKSTGDSKSLSWSIIFEITEATNGSEYTITANVHDAAGNQGKKSKDYITVTVDSLNPSVSISSPKLISYLEDPVSVFEAYDENSLHEVSNIGKFQNKTFTLKGSVKEDSEITALTIYLDNNVVESTDISEAVVKKTVTGDLRNWSTEITPSDFSSNIYSDGNKHLLRVVSQTSDVAGNVELKTLGWLIYWDKADFPWVTPDFSGMSSASDDEFVITTSYPLRGSAYDDDGLKAVYVKKYIMKQGEDTYTPEKDEFDHDKITTIEISGAPKNKNWEIIAPEFICHFYLEISCEDITGQLSTVETRYCYVQSVIPPEVTFDKNDGTELLSLCDKDGKFNLSGSVVNSEKITSVKIVKIVNADNRIKYLDKVKEGEGETEKYAWHVPDSGYTSDFGDLIWEVYNSSINGSHYDNDISKYKESFNLNLNLFAADSLNFRNDFSGSDRKISTQTFIVYAENESGNSTITEYSLVGDDSNPEISITSIKAGSNDEFNISAESKTLKALKSGEKIIVKGTWNDNSYATFGNIDYLNLVVKGQNSKINFIPILKEDKTWEATYEVSAEDDFASVSIVASLEDLAGNNNSANFSFFLDNNKPQFLGYNSDSSGTFGIKTTNNGTEKDTVIPIYMEFNKPIKVSGTPELTLNNGGKAIFDSSTNNSDKFKFNYTVKDGGTTTPQLYVTELTNNLIWTDVASGMIIESDDIQKYRDEISDQSLSKRKNISIDKTGPVFDKVEYITAGNASYKAGKQIIFNVMFNEELDVSSASNFKVKMNSGTNAYAEYQSVNGKNLNFRYTIKDGENSNNLKAEKLTYTGSIKDSLGNTVTSINISLNDSNIRKIVVDTVAPDTPVINSLVKNKTYYSDNDIKFTITYKEDGGTKEFSLDDGDSWYAESDLESKLPKVNQTYFVRARHTDAAGNQSTSDKVEVKLDKGDCLESITIDYPNGTCRSGKIPINLNFRKNVYFNSSSKPTITLNVNNNGETDRTVELSANAVNGSRQLTFIYEVKPGDSCDKLAITKFEGTLYDKVISEDSKSEIPVGFATNKLSDNVNIEVSTAAPIATLSFVQIGEKVNTGDADGVTEPTLKITFDKVVNKNSGKIIITQDEKTYKAPAMLSNFDYDKYSSYISSYYSRTTNGCDSNGKPYTTEKWILNYDQSTTAGSPVSDALKTAKAHVVEIPVASDKVEELRNSSGKVIGYKVSLKDAYALKVKGASYSVKLPQGFVKDDNGEPNAEASSSFTLNGVEDPVIRVRKGVRETINNGSVTQPFTTTAVIDCQTPGAKIKYKKMDKKTVEMVLSNNGTDGDGDKVIFKQNGTAYSKTDAAPNDGCKDSDLPDEYNEYKEAITLGSDANDTDKQSGYKCLIKAYSEITVNENNFNTESTPVYESAMKTVIYLDENNSNRDAPTQENYKSRWIRGGDAQNGGNSTSDVNFPYSWNTSEFNKVRAMTTLGNNRYFWATWDLNITSYVMFLAGDMYGIDGDVATNGPRYWWWMSCGWTQDEDNIPVFPGERMTFKTDKDVSSKYWTAGYIEGGDGESKKHLEERNTDGTVTKSVD